MQNDDQIRLRHMLEAAEEAISLSEGKTRNDLSDDRVLALALVKLIEIIGEAATRISKEGQAQIAEIPWPSIISMRNRLIHAYFDIDLDRVWDTVTDDLPPLIEALRNALPSEPE